MILVTRNLSGFGKTADEIRGLRRALDRSYARIRERARSEWEPHYRGPDPADACVSIRIGQRDPLVA